ncbi:MAG: hypothetical protein ACFB0B_18965 [Thermonemataceae bacterium]
MKYSFLLFVSLLASQVAAQSTTKLLLGEWEIVNKEPTQMDIYNTLAFQLDGTYVYTLAHLLGKGYWSLGKKNEIIYIKDFQFSNTEAKQVDFKFRLEKITKDTLIISRKVKGRKITNTYHKLVEE